MAVSVDQFGKAVVSSGLMTAEEVRSFWNAIPTGERPKDAEGFASLLVQRERLNAFQAEEILSGSKTPLVLGDYVLLCKIGEGGMGQVFKAEHRHMKRLAAIKLLPSALTKDEAAVKRFQREVQAAAKLSNPNIVQTHDAGVQRGIWYLVMEFVDGSDLSAIVRKSGPLSVRQAADYILQTARGLAFAHSKGVVHRDIKPANLLLDNEGVIKILDMGLARIDGSDNADHQLTNSGIVMGTVDYMAPEQANDTRRADARSDVYSLGCTLYRLLTGESVYGGETVIQKIMAHLNEPIPMLTKKRPDVTRDLDRIFQKMMAKKPEDRFQQASEVVAALDAWRNPGATVSFSNQVVKPQDINASDFSIDGSMPSSDVAATSAAIMPLLKQTAIAETEATLAFSQAELKTDPKSEILASRLTGAPPGPSPKPAVGGNRNKRTPIKLIAVGAAGFLILLFGTWVIIRNKDGKEVARVPIPNGGTATVVEQSPNMAPETSTPTPPTSTIVHNPPATSQIERLLSDDYVWSEPELLGPVVNAGKNTRSPTLSDDQLCLIVARRDGSVGSRKLALYELRRPTVDGPWGDAIKLPDGNEIRTPSLSSDGLLLVCEKSKSNTPRDLMLSTRPSRDAPWGQATPIASLNTSDAESRPVISPDGLSLVFNSNRAGGLKLTDLWISRRADLNADWQPPVHLGNKVNSSDYDHASQILTDGKTILVHQKGGLYLAAPDALGVYDLRPVPLPPNLKTGKCWLSPDGATLYFDNHRGREEEEEANEIRLIRRVPK